MVSDSDWRSDNGAQRGGEIMSRGGGVFVPQVGVEDHPSNRVSCFLFLLKSNEKKSLYQHKLGRQRTTRIVETGSLGNLSSDNLQLHPLWTHF